MSNGALALQLVPMAGPLKVRRPPPAARQAEAAVDAGRPSVGPWPLRAAWALLRCLLGWLGGPLLAAGAACWVLQRRDLGQGLSLDLSSSDLLALLLGVASAAKAGAPSSRAAGIMASWALCRQLLQLQLQHRPLTELARRALTPLLGEVHPALLGVGIYVLATRLLPSRALSKALLLGPALTALAAPMTAGQPYGGRALLLAALAGLAGIGLDLLRQRQLSRLLGGLLSLGAVALSTAIGLIPSLRRASLALAWRLLEQLHAWLG